MKKTIQSRITLVLVVSIFFVTLIGGLSLYYISNISNDIEQIIKKDIIVERSAGKIKSQLINLQRLQRIYVDSLKYGEELIDLEPLIDELKKSIDEHIKITIYPKNLERLNEMKKIWSNYHSSVIQLKNEDVAALNIRNARKKLNAVNESMQNIISEVLDYRYQEIDRHQRDIEILIENALRNMLLFLFISIAGGLILIVIAPRQVTAPFHRFVYALKEFEELKFDTRLPVHGEDEVSVMGREVNQLLERLSVFDEIKRKRIQFEKNKQRVLCNMLDQGVLFLSIEGEILFLNAQLLKVLNLSAEGYQGKHYEQAEVPNELKEMFRQFLKTKGKTDNMMMILNYHDLKTDANQMVEVLVDIALVRNYKGETVNIIFTFEDISNLKGESIFKRISIT